MNNGNKLLQLILMVLFSFLPMWKGGTALRSLDSYIQKALLHVLRRKSGGSRLVVGKWLKTRDGSNSCISYGEYLNSRVGGREVGTG